MKIFALTILCSLLVTPLAFCDTASFQVGATIPRIIGVNYFPESADVVSNTERNVTQLVVLRNGQQVLLRTSVVK